MKNCSKTDEVIVCKLADGGPIKRRSRDSGKNMKNNNFSGTNFSGTQLRINISGQNFNANNDKSLKILHIGISPGPQNLNIAIR